MTKTIKGVGVIKRLGRMKTASSAFSSHNIWVFLQSHLDYGDVLYHQLNNKS